MHVIREFRHFNSNTHVHMCIIVKIYVRPWADVLRSDYRHMRNLAFFGS